jgi:glutamyl-tRNA reductase
VILRDIDDLRGVAETAMGTRVGEVSAVEAIIVEELDRFATWESAGASAPIAAALKAKGERITAAEIERIGVELESMTPRQRAAVERLAHRVAAKVLHGPLSKAKELAGSAQGHLYLVAVRELFELDDQGDGE